MRNKWYSDNRDIVKWSTLLLLARRNNFDRIIQIAFLNASEFADIEIDDENHKLPQDVLSHFREIRNITSLSQYPKISVFDCSFGDREAYIQAANNYISAFAEERCIVFLDPDTGLEPNGGGDARHVLNREARDIWDALPGEWLFVFYQHETNKTGRPWIEQKIGQLADALDIPIERIGVAKAPSIARDVVLFHILKTNNLSI